MKIVYCINGVYNSGGMERVLMTKANYFAEHEGYEVIIVTSQQEGRPCFYSHSPNIRFYDLGINYDKDLKYNLFIRSIYKWRKKIKHRRQLSRFLFAEKPDVCISMFDFDFNFLYKIKDGSKKILEYHFCKQQKVIETTNLLLKFLQYIRVYWIWPRIIKHYDKFVVLTEEDKASWGNLPNIISIKNPIAKLPDKVADVSVKQVLSVGRICYQKGFERLIKIWAQVSPLFPDWKLLIRGNGNPSKLLLLSQKLGVENSLMIKPATAAIAEEYQNSSLYVSTARYEGLPMVIMEAMSYGLPVISFDCPCGPKELVQPGFGSLVKNGDIDAFANELVKWMRSEEMRREAGIKAREYISRYSQEEIMRAWLSLFDDLLK